MKTESITKKGPAVKIVGVNNPQYIVPGRFSPFIPEDDGSQDEDSSQILFKAFINGMASAYILRDPLKLIDAITNIYDLFKEINNSNVLNQGNSDENLFKDFRQFRGKFDCASFWVHYGDDKRKKSFDGRRGIIARKFFKCW